MTFSNPRQSSRHSKSQVHERKLHLGLELLERRCLLSASTSSAGMPADVSQSGPAPAPATIGAPSGGVVANQPAPAVASAAAVASDPSGSLSGYVFFETTPGSPNFNPTAPATGESPLAGVTVTLDGPGGTQTTQTDATGTYSFGDLTPGTYSLSITPPTGDTAAQAIANGSNGTAGTGTISNISIGSGQNQAGENFAVDSSSVKQLSQIFFTASLLVSGAQIPIAPFEQVITPAPTPNVPQQVAPPMVLPGLSGRTLQVAGSQNLPQGGSGGDAIIGGANPASPLYAGNVQDEIWPTFGEQGVNNWLNEGPEEDIMQRLNDLGDMNLLNGGGDRGLPNSTSPSGAGTDGNDSRGGNDRLNDLFNFNFNDREFDDDLLRDSDLIRSNTHSAGEAAEGHAVRLDPIAVAPIATRRLPTETEWSAKSSVSAAAVAAWMLVTSGGGEERDDRIGCFERRRRY
jgi:hypothetical protein